MPDDAQNLSGLQKAAILLVTLGVDRSSSVLQNLAEVELERVLLALSDVGTVSIDSRRGVMQEAHDLALAMARRAWLYALPGG